MDTACANTTCPSFVLGAVEGDNLFTGTLINAPEDAFDATCSSQSYQDLTFEWTAPQSGCGTFYTGNGSSDTILTLFDGCPQAGGLELACDDDGGDDAPYNGSTFSSVFTYDVVAGSTYYIGVDSWSSAQSATFILDVNIDANTSCQ